MTLLSGTALSELRQVDTDSLPADGGQQYNRLIFSSSPYLLQHADNPIDWFPWSEEAFSKAAAEDRPVLISIGYSTCHWCHVMAHESFSDPEVADYLNRNFVAIKVDREERPDIDSTYMAACQMMTGSGGWPLTILASADKRPFYAATYLPKRSRQGLPGMMELMHKVMELWHSERAKLLQTGQQVTQALLQLEIKRRDPAELSEQPLQRAADQLRQQYDGKYAGFGNAPKFPAPHNLTLLMQLSERFADTRLAEMAVATLRAIRNGGIYDQVGYGLHRYSVDERWLVPHFEKMLYDQALYILACLSAPPSSGLADAATATVVYVLEQLRHPRGGFFCGEDADSDGDEGTFYLWTPAQVAKIIGEGAAAKWNARFNICPQGHFEGKSIPHLEQQRPGLTDPPDEEFESWRLALKHARARRIRPHLDDKILTAWNGLMIAALARHAASAGQQASLQAATAAFDFIRQQLQADGDRLRRSYCHGKLGSYGFLEDYACFSWGAAELYQASGELRHLKAALHWCEGMLERFSDDSGGLFDTDKESEVVLTRGRSLQDGTVPSGTSVACYITLRLGRLTGRCDLEQRGEALLEHYLGAVERYPSAFTQLLQALDFALGPTTEVTIIRGDNHADAEQMLQLVRTSRVRHLQHLVVDADEPEGYSLAPRTSGQTAHNGKSTAYVCSGNRCLKAVCSATDLDQLLTTLAP